jgi:hypothetical protein
MMMVAAAAFFPARAEAQTYRYQTQIGSRGSMSPEAEDGSIQLVYSP